MTFRKVIFWMHLIAGAVAGIVVLIMSVTGVALTYERQMIAWAEREARTVNRPEGASRLPVETLLARFREARKQDPSALVVRSDPRAAAEVSIDGRTIYLNPYTGAETGEASAATRSAFRKITAWHRWLGQEGEGRAAARAITGACNLAFLFLVVSGAYLWIPRKWAWPNIRAVTFFRRGLSGKARDFNWHNVAGIWMAIPLFFVVFTAVFMSYPWATNTLYRITGTEAPSFEGKKGPGKGFAKKKGRRPEGGGPGGRQGREGRHDAEAHQPVSFDGLNALWAKAEQQTPDWLSISLRVPHSEREPVSFTIDRAERGRPDLRQTIVLSRQTQEIVRAENFAELPLGRRLRTWIRWVHTGEAGGVVGQTLAGIASAAGVLLVYTGIALALRRFFAWRKRQAGKLVQESRAA